MLRKIFSAFAVIAGILGLASFTASAKASDYPVMSVSGTHILENGQVFVPRGISLDTLQYPNRLYLATGYSSPLAEIEAQMQSAKTYWNANTVRIQFEQDVLVSSSGTVNTSYKTMIGEAVSYAQSLGLVPVLSLQTEPSYDASGASTSLNEPMPTWRSAEAWKALSGVVNPGVMLDVFNEPRGTNVTAAQYKSAMNAQIYYIRKDGYQNVLWVQAMLGRQLHYFYSTGAFSDSQVVYAYHHLPGNPSDWDYDVGDWAADHAVIDGEWTNRTMGVENANQCWTNAPTAVPQYLGYLKSHNIGLLAWTLGEDSGGDTFMNEPGGGFDSADGYNSSYSCTQKEGTEGAGQDLRVFFTASYKWVPYVIGDRVSVAESKIRAAGFHTWNYSTTVPVNHEGIVTSQPYRYMPAGSWVSLTFKIISS